MIVSIKASCGCLWRKIRLRAFPHFILPNASCQKIRVGQSYHFSCIKMETSLSMKSLLKNDKDAGISLSSKSHLTIAVEGNIGSGKSTMMRHFEQNDMIEVLCEPIDKWTNVKGHNALGLLYEDPQRWSFSFNMYALLTRVNMHMKPFTRPVKMLERSLYSTKHCFIQNSFIAETINGFEYSILSQWYNCLISDNKADIDLIVYLRADPDVCYERLKKRSRKEEDGVPKDLIESLHHLHDDWLLHKKYPIPAPVLVLDANSDFSTMKEIYDQTRQDILCNYKPLVV